MERKKKKEEEEEEEKKARSSVPLSLHLFETIFFIGVYLRSYTRDKVEEEHG